MFLSQEHQQHGQAYKKNTGEDFFSVDFFPGRLFHLISLPQRSPRTQSYKEKHFPEPERLINPNGGVAIPSYSVVLGALCTINVQIL